MKSKLTLLTLLLANVAQAGPIKGNDYLGGAKYSDEILSAHPMGYAAGFFLETFGDALPIINKLAASGRTSLIRTHLAWRDNHTISSSEIPGIAKKAGVFEPLTKKYPNVTFQVSGLCEHKLNSIDAKRMRDGIKKACPSCEFVNSPWTGAILSGEINEVHGVNPKKPGGTYQVSTDGDNINDMDADKWQRTYDDSKVRFGWAPRFNLRQKGTTAPPKLRTAKPTTDYIKQVSRLNQPKGNQPAFSFPVKKFPKGWIYKTDAEDQQGTQDGRHNKPLFINKYRSGITLKTSNGKSIGMFAYYGSYQSGLYRAYSGYHDGINLYGYAIGAKAREVSGSEFIALCVKKECWGPVSAAFREPPR